MTSSKPKLVWARERCSISPFCFLAECRKRHLNQGSFVLLYSALLTWFLSCSSYTVLFISMRQVIGCENLHPE